MKILPMVRAEFARLWATGMARLALVALMCVPLLYGGLYLWANQNPYDKLNQVPVALVVADTGEKTGDTVRTIGDEVAKNLLEDGSFAWHRVSEEDAEYGIAHGAYDFVVTLPKDFTAALQSSQTGTPRQADVILTTNDANSYLASTIGEQAVKRIQQQIVQSVNREAARTMLDGFAQIRVSLTDAASGAGQLADGSRAAGDGAGKLASGLDQLRNGTAELPSKTSQLADGAARVAAGNGQVASVGRDAVGYSQQALDALRGDRESVLQRMRDAGVDQAVINDVTAAMDRADAGLVNVNGKIRDASSKLDALAAGSQQLADGSRQLADATPQLAEGIAAAATGAGDLGAGIGKLTAGSDQLREGLTAGADKLPDSTEDLRQKQAENLANPVSVETARVTSAGSYGAGLAPFFASLAAWIGIYALFLILKPVSRRAVTALHTPLKVTLAGWLTPAMLGAVQMAALFGIVSGVLGFKFVHPLAAYGMLALASATFASIILALNIWLGSVGQFLGLVLMVVQLVTAGGTFPWQTLPEPLATLHHYLPMSFAVDGLRQLMYGGDLTGAGSSAIKLVLVLLAALLLSALGVARMMRSRTLKDLQPSLIG